MLYYPKLELFLEPDPHEFLCLLFFLSNSQFSIPPNIQNCKRKISLFLNICQSASISSNFGCIPEIAEILIISALKALRGIILKSPCFEALISRSEHYYSSKLEWALCYSELPPSYLKRKGETRFISSRSLLNLEILIKIQI